MNGEYRKYLTLEFFYILFLQNQAYSIQNLPKNLELKYLFYNKALKK